MIIYLPELSGHGGIDHFKFQTWIINSIPIFSNIHQWSGHNQNYVALRISYQYRCLGQPSQFLCQFLYAYTVQPEPSHHIVLNNICYYQSILYVPSPGAAIISASYSHLLPKLHLKPLGQQV